jgi:hypothetical protein
VNEEAHSINRFRRLHRNALINRDTNCAGEAKMQCRDATKSARILVLASDWRKTMLVRRQAHAFEILAGVAHAGFSTTEFRWRTYKRSAGEARQSIGFTSVGTGWFGYFWSAVACYQNDALGAGFAGIVSKTTELRL